MNTIREVRKINQEELDRGIAGTPASWHTQYASSAWVYVGNLDHALTEGDIICVLSQYGEIEDLHLIREEDTGKSRGFAFCKYEDARSCVLAVDNFCGVQLLGRSLRIDHVENYKLPKHILEKKDDGQQIQPGLAYKDEELANEFNLKQGQDLFAPITTSKSMNETKVNSNDDVSISSKQRRKEERQRIREERERRRRERKEKKHKRHRSKRKRHDTDDDNSEHKRRRKEKRKRSESVASAAE